MPPTPHRASLPLSPSGTKQRCHHIPWHRAAWHRASPTGLSPGTPLLPGTGVPWVLRAHTRAHMCAITAALCVGAGLCVGAVLCVGATLGALWCVAAAVGAACVCAGALHACLRRAARRTHTRVHV